MEKNLQLDSLKAPSFMMNLGIPNFLARTRKTGKTFAKMFSFLFLMLLVFSEARSQCYTAPNYCTAITAANNANYGMGIQNVTLYTSAIPTQINNTTTAGQGTQIYFNYTSMIVKAGAGDSVYFSIKGGNSNQTLFRIYLDYNGDGTFNTTTPELVYTSANLTTVNTIVNGSFIVPSTVSAGTYRIRVASDGQGLIPAPCGPITYSAEYEDYTLLVPATVPDFMSTVFTQPASAVVGNNTVAFSFTNISNTTITSVDINYQLGTNFPVTQSLTSISVLPGATYTGTFTTQVSLPATGSYLLKAWTSNPNYAGNNTPGNDTICKNIVTYCSGPLAGAYTINPAGSGSTNFKSFGGLDSALMSCGVSGAVVATATTGVYNEGLTFTAIPGASPTNTVTIFGNGSTLLYACNATNLSVVRFQGAKYITLDSLNIKTSDINYGWGVHFYLGSDSNTVRNSTIDISSVTSSTSTNSAGIVFSNSLTSPTTTGITGYRNNIINNLIKGNPTGAGMYYGIVGAPSSAATNVSANRFVNNRIENFYVYGIYWSNGNRTLFRGNRISRPTKSTITTTYAFYLSSSSRADTIDGNTITNLFGGSPTSTSTTYIFYGINYSGLSTEPNTFCNNLVYDLRGDGPQYGFYFQTSYCNRIYNNTLLFDNTTASSNVTNGLYFTGGTSATNFLDFRNNIISITRAGSGAKNALFTSGSWAAGTTMNKNAYYSNAANYALCSYLGVNYTTLANWKTIMPTLDQQSLDYSPNFVNTATQNYSPRDGGYDGTGDNVIASVPTDYRGTPRALPMDIGAFEASPIPVDAAIGNIILPLAPYTAGSQVLYATIRNAGTTTITTATINWSVNGVTQTPVAYSGTLIGGAFSGNIALGSASIAANTMYTIQVWVSSPNGLTDPNTTNDLGIGYTAAAVSGSVTINAAGSGAGVFNSFTAFSNILKIGGLGGAVTANVTVGSGPYNEQAQFFTVAGASATNTVTINGNGEYLQFNNTDPGNIGIVNLIGANYITVNNLKIKSLNASYGIGVIITANSNYNKITNCLIDIGSVTGSSFSAGVAFTSSLSSATLTGTLNGTNNLIENNVITGNASGGPYYGIGYCPTTSSNAANTYNVIRNNIIRDFTYYGFYIMYSAGSTISGNIISRPNKSAPTTFMGFYAINGLAQDTIENNVIKQPFNQTPTTTNTFYGYYFSTPNVPSTRPVILRNNQMYDIKSAGAIYGIYQASSTYLKFLNNNFVIDHAASTSASTCYLYYNSGTPTTTTIRNNIFYLNRGGAGAKYIYYLATTGVGYVINNNVLSLKQTGTNNYIGYYAGNYATLATWKTVNTNAYDQNSVAADPQFRLSINPEYYQPGADSINNIGFATPDVTKDVVGVTRSATPDPGAYEFSVPAADAGISRVAAPLNPLSLGTQSVNVILKSFGASPLTSANVDWKVNDVLQTPNTWYGYMANGDSANFTAGTYSFSNPGFYRIKAWSSLPNGVSDSFPLNDTVNVTVCTPLAGTYFTINPSLPTSDTNFVSISAFTNTLQTCGVAGPVAVTVAPGVYNNQITFNGPIPGSSATNNVVFNGTDSATTKIVHDGSIQRATLLFNNARNITFRNFTIEASAISGGGFGVLFTNAADSNKIIRCTVKTYPQISTNANSAFVPILSSASLTAANTAGNNANFLLIDSCRVLGGYYGIDLYNNSTAKATDNVVSNCEVIQTYYYGIIAYWQNKIIINNNKFNTIGNNSNASSFSIYSYQCDGGIKITKNQIFGQIGGYGMYMYQHNGTALSRNIVANNMLQLGLGTNTTYGIYDGGTVYTDIAHNTVNNTSGDASYVSTAVYFSYGAPATANNLRMVNNIFTAPNGAMALFCPSTVSLSSSSVFLNNNVYYSPSSYPFRLVNTIYPTLTSYKAGLGAFIPGVDSNAVWFNPTFFSATNLRTISPQVDSIGLVLPTVTDDIDGKIRSTNAPDAGVYEFARPGDDAGVAAILKPFAPVSVGKTDVKVLIKNFGLNTLTSVDVNYKVGTTVVTRSYTGTLLPGAVDTVTFDSTSGPLASDQRFNYLGGSVDMKAYTSNPNLVADFQNLNDTSYLSFCGALNGVYTINPSGVGANNFTSFAAAVNNLNCGGVSGNVIFNVASGTYVTQVDISTISGANDSARVTFKSATGNAADVILTSSTSTSLDNYTLRLKGANYVNIEKMTIRNTNATYGRVISINKFASLNANTNNVVVRGCILEGSIISSTADQYAIIYSPGGDNANNLTFVSNAIKYGSYSVYVGGQSIINLYSPGLVIDSNTLTQPYYAGVYLTSRKDAKIRYNYLDGSNSYGYYGMYLSGVSGDMEVIGNNIQSPMGTYGLYISTLNYYGEIGYAKITNNIINLASSSTQYGIYLNSSSNAYFINNTVRCATTTTSYAYYFSGNTTSVTVPQIVASNNVRLINNILYTAAGYPVYYANANAISGTSAADNNLYYTTAANFAYVNGVNYAPSAMNTTLSTFRNALYMGSDRRSLHAPIAFTSATDLKPLVSNNQCWAANGRGQQNTFVSKDFNGLNRSITVATGATDIGACEFTPTVIPASATITGSIMGGNTQYLIAFGDTVGKIVWGYSGTLPTSIDATYHTGALISDPTNGGRNIGAHYMDVFWRVTASGGAYYSYDISFNFDPNMLGTVPSMSDIKLAKKQTGVSGTWTHYGYTLTTVDSVNYNFGVMGLPDFSDFTGTSDFAPLPVKLARFEAVRSADDALLNWNTVSELNSRSFEIERAGDGKNFVKIGSVNAAGNSSKGIAYQFEDLGVANVYAANRAYYRLKMIDKDGKFEYSPVRVVDFSTESEGAMAVYPNPFADKLSLTFNNLEEGIAQIEVIDLFGKVCYKSEQMINAANPEVVLTAMNKLSNGVYVIKVSKGSTIYTHKLIKE